MTPVPARRRFAQRSTEQGVQQSLQQGEAAILLRQFVRKVGLATAKAHRPRIETADTETLRTWSERILDADSPEHIFRVE